MERPAITQDGKMWAVLSYGSIFIGFPIGIVPLIMKNDAYALHHAKQAVGVFIAFLTTYLTIFALAFLLFFCTFGLSNFVIIPLLFALMLWPFINGVHGIVIAANEQWDAPVGSFGIGDRLFAGLKVPDALTVETDPVAPEDAEEIPPPLPE